MSETLLLFNSYIFIFAFLPLTLLVYIGLRRGGHHRVAVSWLVLSSLFFYGWWDYRFLAFLFASIVFNFLLGGYLRRNNAHKKLALWIGIGVNLGMIGYFKYANFLVEAFNEFFATNLLLGQIILPLAISFFTFQQIAYLVDAYRGATKEYDFINYCLFVTFFPQLIAGPIVHHKEVMPQFEALANVPTNWARHIAIGLTIFILGLFKKVVVADGVAEFATPVFTAAHTGNPIDLLLGWRGALAYTLQLYFDFSGYSDMAIGLARMFGIMLPLNFNAPYRSLSITEFWRRWHMTLSRFLRDYVYIPLGGNRRGPRRRYINLFATMLLGGLWHGAGWTFVLWGGLHGLYLIFNHGWHAGKSHLTLVRSVPVLVRRGCALLLTFTAVVVGWVFFRAEDLGDALIILKGMAGFNGIELPEALVRTFGPLQGMLPYFGISFSSGGGGLFVKAWATILVGLAAVWLLPTTQQFMRYFDSAWETDSVEFEDLRYGVKIPDRLSGLYWSFSAQWALALAALAFLCTLSLTRVSEFLYFQF